MKYDPSYPSRDAWILGLVIARAIRCGADEKDALRRNSVLLGFWNISIGLEDLGTYPS